MPDVADLLREYASEYGLVDGVRLEVLPVSTLGIGERGAHKLGDGTVVAFLELRLRLTQFCDEADGNKRVVNYVEFNSNGDLRAHSFQDSEGEPRGVEAIQAAVCCAQVMTAQLGFGV